MNKDAIKLQTLPRYVYYVNETPRDALSEIKEEKSQDLNAIIQRYQSIFGSSLNYEEDIAYPWIVYSPGFNRIPTDQRSTFLFSLEMQTNMDTLGQFYSTGQQDYRQKLEKEIDEFIKTAQMEERVFSIDESKLDIQPFELKKVQRMIRINNVVVPSADFLMNTVWPSDLVPFIRTKDFYKIHTRSKFNKNWLNIDFPDVDNVMMIVLNEFHFFFFVEDTHIEVFYEINVNTFKEEDEIIQTAFTIFPTSVDYDIIESRLTGNFMIPNQTFQSAVFADLCFTNPAFRSHLLINEQEKATRLRQSNLFVRFRSDNVGLVTFSMLQVGKDIRIRVSRANTLDDIKLFQIRFLQLMDLYNRRKDIVIQVYRQFLPNFGTEEQLQQEKVKEKSLKEIAPDLFLTKYTRKCSYLPTIISPEEAKEKDEDMVMEFPKTPEEGTQYLYYCPNPIAPYPGLRKNPMENKDKYPFIPCCYVDDQRIRRNSPFMQYYYGARSVSKSNVERLITTSKFVSYGQQGSIPSSFSNLFSVFIGKPVTIIRTGVHNSASSLLECVLMQTDEYKNASNKLNYVENARVELVNDYLEICKQEWYDQPLEFLTMLISDTEAYLNPKHVVQLIEHVYNCECVILTRSKEGFLNVFKPSYAKFYVEYEMPVRPRVYIYEHWGSESDMAAMPRCELLLVDDPVSPSITKLFNLVQQFTIDGKLLDKIELCPLNPTSQLVDQFGKLRGLIVDDVTILTDPLPPMALPITTEIKIASREKGEQIANKFNFTGIVATSESLRGRCGSVSVEIPFKQPAQQSALREYIRTRQLAQYLVQVVRYSFASFLESSGVLEDDKLWLQDTELYEQFAERFIKIGEKEYSFPLPTVFSDKAIVVRDYETRDRLMYDLIRYSLQFTKKFKDYIKLEFIPREFDQVSDFKMMTNTLVLKIM